MVEQSLPTLMDASNDEEFTAKTIKHAKYFTIIRYVRGGYRIGRSNHERHERPTLEEARELAGVLRAEEPANSVIIYAVADFIGAHGFSRPVEFFPKKEYVTRGDREKIAKAERAAAREKAREVRAALKPAKPTKKVAEAPETLQEGFWDADTALAYITDD